MAGEDFNLLKPDKSTIISVIEIGFDDRLTKNSMD